MTTRFSKVEKWVDNLKDEEEFYANYFAKSLNLLPCEAGLFLSRVSSEVGSCTIEKRRTRGSRGGWITVWKKVAA